MMMLMRFVRDRAGVALTEYTVMIGLVTAGILLAVVMIFKSLAVGWAGFAGGVLTVQEIDAGTSGGGGQTAPIAGEPAAGASAEDDRSDDDDASSEDDDDTSDDEPKGNGKGKAKGKD